MDGLPETGLNLEAPSVEANDVQGGHAQVGTQQNQPSTAGMDDPDEADQLAQGTPQQVVTEITQRDGALVVERAGGGVEAFLEAKPISEFGFAAVAARSPAPLALGRRGRKESHRIAAHARDQVMAAAQKVAGKFSGGVISVGDDGDRSPPIQAQQELA